MKKSFLLSIFTLCSIVLLAQINPSIIASTNATCFNMCDGSATAECTDGTGPYTYLWDASAGSQTTQTATGLCPGIYSVIVTDNLLATGVTMVTISEPTALNCDINGTEACYGLCNGTADISVSGGVMPYTYYWSNTEISPFINNLCPSDYAVSVTDYNGCIVDTSINIAESSMIVTSFSTTNPSCTYYSDGSINLTVSGSNPPYSFDWSNFYTTEDLDYIMAGKYNVTVYDALGCQINDSVELFEPDQIILTLVKQSPTCFNGNDGSVDMIVTGGISPFAYTWSNQETTEDIIDITGGDYYVTVTDANGCQEYNFATISDPQEMTFLANQTDPTCGSADGSAEMVYQGGGTPPFNYLWSDSGTTNPSTNIPAGHYEVTITDINTCSTVHLVDLSDISGPIVIIDSINDATCYGWNDGDIYMTTTGGTSPYSYLWSTSQVTEDITGLYADYYTVIATDFIGCKSTNTISINEPDILNAEFYAEPPYCSGYNDGYINVNPIGGVSPYSYLWNNSFTDPFLSSVSGGTYTITINDFNGCFTDTSITIADPPPIVIDSISSEDISCYGLVDGRVEVFAAGGIGSLEYSIDGGGLWQSDPVFNFLEANIYSVVVKDSNYCQISGFNPTINEPTQLIITPSFIDASCFGQADGEASVFTSGGTSPYTYMWNSGETTQTITGIVAGNYPVSVADDHGCNESLSITIGEPSDLIASTIISDESCSSASDGSVTLSVSGGTLPYYYSWTGPSAFSSASSNISGLQPGIYNLTITDASACIFMTTATINPGLVIVTDAGSDLTICEGSDINLNGSVTGATGAVWATSGSGIFIPDNTTLSAIYSPSANDIILGSLTLSLTSTGNGTCLAQTDSLVVTIQSDPIVNAGIDQIVCENTNFVSITGSITNGIPQSWSTNGTGTFDDAYALITNYNISAEDTTSGSVTLTLSSTSGSCATITDSVVITIIPAFTIAMSSTETLCFGDNNGTATATPIAGSSPYIYLWSNAASSGTITGLSAGNYIVTVTDATGCENVNSIEVLHPDDIILSTSITDVSCYGDTTGEVSLSVTGGIPGYTYFWNNTSTSQNQIGIDQGTYNVTVTDANGCTSSTSVIVSEPVIFTATISSFTNVSCNSLADGNAMVAASGGITPYTYLWSNGNLTNNATGLIASNYNVTVTDNNGCETTSSVAIIEPSALNISLVSLAGTSCNGFSDGEVTVTAGGGATPYSYQWSSGGTSATETGLSAGSYTVTLTDNNLCTSTHIISITEPEILSADISSVQNISCFGGSNGTATAFATGGVAPYSFSWPNGGTSAVVSGLTAGLHEVTVTDANNCPTNTLAYLIEPEELTSSITPGYVSCFGDNDGSAVVIANGGTLPYNYHWSTGANLEIVAGLIAGDYFATVTDTKGCSSVSSVTITEPYELLVLASSTDASCFGNSNGSASAIANGGTPGYSYNWSNGNVTSLTTGLNSGIYYITITDANGCKISESVIISEPSQIEIFKEVTNATCTDSNNGAIDITTYGGTTPYTFLWSTGFTTEDISLLFSDNYQLTVTDMNGCELSEAVYVGVTYVTSIYGNVTDEGVPLSNGSAKVEIYSEAASAGPAYTLIASVFTDASGSYSFSELPPDSTYYLKAIIMDNQLYPTAITTYYDTTYSYEDATPISINCDDNLNLNIEMLNIPAQQPASGGYVSGIITFNDAPGDKAMGDPVPGAEIYIEQEPTDEPVANVTTDTTGFYEFIGITAGYSYHLYVDIPGLPLITTHNFIVSEDDTIQNNLDFHVDTNGTGGIYMVEVSSIEEAGNPEFTISMYPNPYIDFVNIEYNISYPTDVNIEVFDINGRKIVTLENNKLKEGSYKHTFCSKKYGMTSGVYFVRLNLNNHIYLKKIIEIEK